MRSYLVALALCLALTAAGPVSRPASAAPADPPKGIAAQYPGDEGIERDPRVLFVEDFETGDVLNNIKILFEGPADARVLLDDFEVRE